MDATDLRRARELLAAADSVCVLTGAGISAESGVPTFRGEEGLWKSYRAEELATPGAFRKDPRLVWEWYAMRRELIAGCSIHDGHRALARWLLGRASRASDLLTTQNVDGLHELAAQEVAREEGLDPSPALPLELHGSIFHLRCSSCGVERTDRDPVVTESEETLPRCAECDGLMRPAVVWFGEALDPEVLDRAFEAAEAADVALVIGTSAVVQPAASIPLQTGRSGGKVIEVNPSQTPLTGMATVSLRGGAGAVLPALLCDDADRPPD